MPRIKPKKQPPAPTLPPLPSSLQHIVVPRHLMNLLRQKVLSARDILLAAEIDALDHFDDREDGTYCTASNQYLAHILGVHESRISASISLLKKHGLVVEVGGDARHRQLHSTVPERYVEQRMMQHRGVTDNSYPTQLLSVTLDKNRLELSPTPLKRSAAKDTASFRPLTKKLLAIISQHRKVVTGFRSDQWDDAFRRLVEIDGQPQEEVSATLDAYAGIFGEEYVPVAWSAKSFREKYGRILDAIERAGRKGNSQRRSMATGKLVTEEEYTFI